MIWKSEAFFGPSVSDTSLVVVLFQFSPWNWHRSLQALPICLCFKTNLSSHVLGISHRSPRKNASQNWQKIWIQIPLTLTRGCCLNFPWLKTSRRGRRAVKVNTCPASKSNIPGDQSNLSPLTLPSCGSNYAVLEAPSFSSSVCVPDPLGPSDRPALITRGNPLRSPTHSSRRGGWASAMR